MDCEALGVVLSRGDTLPGPGLSAALTATTPIGPGDSHRGAVASALVSSLCSKATCNMDFSVCSVPSRIFPSTEEWDSLLVGL